MDCFKARHLKGGQPEYLVHWKGYEDKDATPQRQPAAPRSSCPHRRTFELGGLFDSRSSPSYWGGGASIGTGRDGLGASGKGASVGEEVREGSGEGETQRRVSGTCGTANLVVS